MQREDRADVPPKHREPTQYDDRIQAAKDKLTLLVTCDADFCDAQARSAYDSAVASHAKYAAERAMTKRRYEAMLRDVQDWQPPTMEHDSLKRFMITQLRDSIGFDCDYESPAPKRLSGAEWLAAEKAGAERDAYYYTKLDIEERQRCAESNRWIDALYASLRPPQPSPTPIGDDARFDGTNLDHGGRA